VTRFQPVEALRVTWRGRPVGRLASRDRRLWFEYDPGWLGDPRPLAPFALPARAGVFAGPPTPFEGLHGLFDDSLPDGWGRLLLDREMDRLGVGRARLGPLDRLAWVGGDALGALGYEPITPRAEGPSVVDLREVSAAAARVLAGAADELVAELLAVGGSPGGARPKALIWETPDGVAHSRPVVGGVPWLVKFRGSGDPPDAGPLELAWLRLAADCGVEVPVARLVGRGPRRPGWLAVRRFDRDGEDRVHVATVCGLLHADHRVPSATWEDLLKVTRILVKDEAAVEQQLRRMVFGVLAHDRDDHTRNQAFRMDALGRWSVAPAYDRTFTEGMGGEHALAVAGEGRAPTLGHLVRAGEAAGVDANVTRRVFEEVRAVVGSWERYARDAGVSRATRERLRGRVPFLG
jgi:serine/threonine-protein kinase HipA